VGDALPLKRLVDRALTLDERFHCRRLPGESQRRIALQRIDSCKDWFNRDSNPGEWKRFLCDFGISEPTLWDLAETDYDPTSYPSWAKTLSGLLDTLQTRRSVPDKHSPVAIAFSRPAVGFSWRQLLLTTPEAQLKLLPERAAAQLRNSLLRRLARSAKEAVEWESQVATADQMFEDGIESTVVRILWRYPALARLWAVQIDNWIASTSEFLEKVERFLIHQGSTSISKPSISALVPDLSDPHGGNRTVIKIILSDHAAWFFKPRSGVYEAAWFSLLCWLNEQGFSCLFKRPQIIWENDHSWMEAITHRTCENKAEVRAFFFRAGALLYLAHVLRFVDLHAGNIIAHRGDPIFIDCETLLHPNTRVPQFARVQQRDVFRTGLLPVEVDDLDSRDSLSGYGRRSMGEHLVRLRGQPVFAEAFVEEVTDGFRTMHAFLNSGRYDAFVAIATRCLPKAFRQIRKPTGLYHLILERSFAPRMLISGFDRSLFLHAACRDGIVARHCLDSEIADLENADIPRLSGRPTQILRPLNKARLSHSLNLIRRSLQLSADRTTNR
jgi:hypothetical protein